MSNAYANCSGNPEATPLGRSQAEHAPLALAQRLHRGPAEISAPRTLGFRVAGTRGCGVLAGRPTAETFDVARIHAGSVTPPAAPRLPPTGKRSGPRAPPPPAPATDRPAAAGPAAA